MSQSQNNNSRDIRVPSDDSIIRKVHIQANKKTKESQDGMTINVIQETTTGSKYEYIDGTELSAEPRKGEVLVSVKKSGTGNIFTVDLRETKMFSLLRGKYKRSYNIVDGIVRLQEQDLTDQAIRKYVSTNTRIVGNKRKVCDSENPILTINIMDYVFDACVSVFYSVVLIYGPTQSGKTKTTIQTCIDTMNKEDCPTIFITRNYTDEAEQQFKSARAKIYSHMLDVVFLRNDDDYKELTRCMADGVKTIFIGLGNDTTLTKIAKDTSEYSNDKGKHVKYIMAVDEADIYVNKKEESQTSVLLKGLLDGALRKLFISATLLDVTSLITETDYVDKIPTKFAFGDFCLGDKEYYRSFDSFNKYFIDTKDPIQCLKDVMIESNSKSYHNRGLPYITAIFHSEVNSVNEKNALKMSKMDFKIDENKTVKMSMITSDQTGTKLYVKGNMFMEFDDIQEALTYVRVLKHEFVNVFCGKMFSRAFNVTCTTHLCYISALMYLMRDTGASLMVQRIGRMCGISKLKNKCPQYLYAPEKVVHKCIDTVKINQCMIAQTDRSVPFLKSIPKMVMPKRKTHGNVKLSMTRIEKKLKTDTKVSEDLLESLAPLKSISTTKIKERINKNDSDYEPTKGVMLQILKDKIIKYVTGNDNTYRSHSEWFEITGLCGYKNKTVHHHTMMTYLVKSNFLERNVDKKLKLRY